jgi:hypothetical protein
MDKISLISNVIAQAKFFLEEAGEYYPFGAIVDSNGLLKPLGVFLDDEHPKSSAVVARLTEVMNAGIESKDYKCGAIGVDVLVIEKNTSDKIDALEVQYFELNQSVEKHFFAYRKDGNSYDFREIEI